MVKLQSCRQAAALRACFALSTARGCLTRRLDSTALATASGLSHPVPHLFRPRQSCWPLRPSRAGRGRPGRRSSAACRQPARRHDETRKLPRKRLRKSGAWLARGDCAPFGRWFGGSREVRPWLEGMAGIWHMLRRQAHGSRWDRGPAPASSVRART